MVNKKRENLDMWKAELAWAMVKVVRGDVARAKDNVGIAEKKIETCKEKIEEEKEKQRRDGSTEKTKREDINPVIHRYHRAREMHQQRRLREKIL